MGDDSGTGKEEGNILRRMLVVSIEKKDACDLDRI